MLVTIDTIKCFFRKTEENIVSRRNQTTNMSPKSAELKVNEVMEIITHGNYSATKELRSDNMKMI